MPTTPATSTFRDWRCRRCLKLLGRHDGRSLRLRFSSASDYAVSLPATSVCRCCGRLNVLEPLRAA